MSSGCYPSGGASWHCPTADELAPQALALLPQGRAWATSDGAFMGTSVIARFARSVSDVFAFAYQRICDLREEFWCATHFETHAEWMLEYGLPDACDPFPDLCVKVAALGGASCEYLTLVAARAGWDIACGEPCSAEAGCIEAGMPPGVGVPHGTLIIVVRSASSPAYVDLDSQAEAGCYEAGQDVRCDPLEGLRCLLDRVIHAHLATEFVIEV